jgi:hypothetical protein
MKLYDDVLLQTSNMVNVETVRLKFPYDGKDYMVQLWKGRYFITTAAEIGIYSKPPSRAIGFYDAVDDDHLVPMSFKLVAHKDTGDEALVDRAQIPHWWMTGFAVHDEVYLANRLCLSTLITAPDQAFYDGLTKAIDDAAAGGAPVSYTTPDATDPFTIDIVWDR